MARPLRRGRVPRFAAAVTSVTACPAAARGEGAAKHLLLLPRTGRCCRAGAAGAQGGVVTQGSPSAPAATLPCPAWDGQPLGAPSPGTTSCSIPCPRADPWQLGQPAGSSSLPGRGCGRSEGFGDVPGACIPGRAGSWRLPAGRSVPCHRLPPENKCDLTAAPAALPCWLCNVAQDLPPDLTCSSSGCGVSSSRRAFPQPVCGREGVDAQRAAGVPS